MNKKKPNQEYLVSILDVIKQNRDGASAKKIRETLERRGGCYKDSKIVSYPQIAKLLKGYLFDNSYIKPTSRGLLPSKENFYKLTPIGKEFLEGSKIDSLDYADSIMHPADCLKDCGKEKIEVCWKEGFQWIEISFKTKLTDFQKQEIKKLLKQPVRIVQIENYKEFLNQVEDEIKPFYRKNLYPKEQKILKIINK